MNEIIIDTEVSMLVGDFRSLCYLYSAVESGRRSKGADRGGGPQKTCVYMMKWSDL